MSKVDQMREEIMHFMETCTLSDKAAFVIGFDNNPSGVEFLVRTVLSQNDISIISARGLERLNDGNGGIIIFDILAETDDGSLIGIEMQKTRGLTAAELGRKMQHYLSVLKINVMKMGVDIFTTRKAIALFFVDSDILKTGKPVSTYMWREDDGILLDEGRSMLVVANIDYFRDLEKNKAANREECET